MSKKKSFRGIKDLRVPAGTLVEAAPQTVVVSVRVTVVAGMV